MIYLSTATYFEGESLINILSLKKDNSITKFQVFKNDDITLIITGSGRISSSNALTYLFTRMDPGPSDLLINYGICGSSNSSINTGTTFLCSKIIENSTKNTFYTDILYRSPFRENFLETFDVPVTSDSFHVEADLVDMEASGIYQGATLFLMTHQIYFIKMVSDIIGEDIHNSDLKDKLWNSSQQVAYWINEIKPKLLSEKDILDAKDIELLNSISANLKYSVTMKNDLKKKFIYCKLLNGKIPDTMQVYTGIQCRSKKEGQAYEKSINEQLI